MKLRLPVINAAQFNFSLLLKFLLNIVEIGSLGALPFILFLGRTEVGRLEDWIFLLMLVALSRVLRALFFGDGFSGVPGDIALLFLVTVLLVLVIVNGGEQGEANLGGSSSFGIGSIMLACISIYLYASAMINYKVSNILFHLFFIANVVAASSWFTELGLQDGNLIGDYGAFALPEYFYSALISFLFGVAGAIYFKQRLLKAVYIIGGIVGLFFLVLAMNWINVFGLAAALILLAVLNMVRFAQEFNQLLKLYKKSKNDFLNTFKSRRVFNYLATQVVFLTIVFAPILYYGYNIAEVEETDTTVLSSYITALEDLYSRVPDFISSDQELLVGGDQFNFGTDAASLLLTYGVIGIGAFSASFIILASEFLDLKKVKDIGLREEENKLSRSYLVFFSSYAILLFLATIFISSISLASLLILSFLVAFAKVAIAEKYAQLDFSEELIDFSEIDRRGLKEFLRVSRIVVIVMLLIAFPSLVNTVQGLF
ncbi:MAG: hypothetical protein ACOCXP_02050 [Candidatus Dojkabacteria bacterium]